MIRTLQISNYKSLHDVTLEVGRFNVLIGENGCGKSNLLEAIALVAAAAADKLDNEFLVSRGIRVTEPQLMRSAFSDESLQEPIKIGIGIKDLDNIEEYILNHDNQPYAKWKWVINPMIIDHTVADWDDATLSQYQVIRRNGQKTAFNANKIAIAVTKAFLAVEGKSSTDSNRILKMVRHLTQQVIVGISRRLREEGTVHIEDIQDQVELALMRAGEHRVVRAYVFYREEMSIRREVLRLSPKDKIRTFVIYSPENTALRNFSKEGQIEPLGINGEGLFKLLKVIQSKSAEQWQEIHTSLQFFDWYSELKVPQGDLLSSENKVTITDRYLTLEFDQRSANEGFLLILFYIALMVSDHTPKIFAIDNIDASLNPKLCTKLIKEVVRLAKKYDKQAFVTTHNPAILDGIDLGDEEQRLFVVSRNKQGHTRFKRLTLKDKPRSSNDEELKLSEAFLRGYLGGLPKGF